MLPTLIFTPEELVVNEGGTATYTVELDSDPGEGATATVNIELETLGSIKTGITLMTEMISFSGGATGNWGTPQPGTVTGLPDDDEFDDLAEIDHSITVGTKTIARQSVLVTVTDGNRAPYFEEGLDTTREITETAGQGTSVDDPVTALDLNTSDTLTYSLDDSSGKFDITANNSTTGQITVAADDSLDYETEPDHEVKVTATDTGGLSDTIQVKVIITEVNEPPAITGEAAPAFNENNSITTRVARYSAIDPERDSFTWSVQGTDSSSFNIDTSGNLRFNSQPNHERKDSYEITIVATDDANPPNKGEFPVAVEVVDVNEPPEVVGNDTLSFLENTPTTTVLHRYSARDVDAASTTFTWSLSGTANGDFDISPNPPNRVAGAPEGDLTGMETGSYWPTWGGWHQ